MNKKILILVAFLCLATNFYAQVRPVRDKIKSLKVAFFTERLDLSSTEAESFWPVYNEHEQAMESFRKTERTEFRGKLRTLDGLSDKEAEALLKKYMFLQQEKQKAQQSFVVKMKGILSAKKTILLLKTEEEFKKELIKKYRQRRSGGGGPR